MLRTKHADLPGAQAREPAGLMGEPVVRVLRGAPDETELAVLIAVLAAVGAQPAAPTEPQTARPRQRPRFQPATSWRTRR